MKTLRSLITIMVIMIAVAGAYASKKNVSKFATVKWEVDNVKSTATKIYITANNLTGKVQGVDYSCNAPTTPHCSVQGDSANLMSDANGTYFLASQATVIQGTYQEL